MSQVFQTIWNVLLMGLSLAYFGSLGTATYFLGQSALNLHSRGLISLTGLTRSLEAAKPKDGTSKKVTRAVTPRK